MNRMYFPPMTAIWSPPQRPNFDFETLRIEAWKREQKRQEEERYEYQRQLRGQMASSSSYTFKPVSPTVIGGLSLRVLFLDKPMPGRLEVDSAGQIVKNNRASTDVEDAIAEAWRGVSAHQRIVWKREVKDRKPNGKKTR